MVLNVNVEETNTPIQHIGATNEYWTNTNSNKGKPKFTYDDILTSLNLSVSQNGVLQRMSIKPDINTVTSRAPSTSNNVTQPKSGNNGRIEPEVKHSYIYNKYFKNYSGENPDIIVPRIPKTREEYRQMLLEDAINRQQAKHNASIVKSTKMLYTNTNTNTNANTFAPTNVNRNNLNRLFRIKQ
jgi:hypothetical protein